MSVKLSSSPNRPSWRTELKDERLRALFGAIPRETFGLNFDILDPRFLGPSLESGNGYHLPPYLQAAQSLRRPGITPTVVAVDVNQTLANLSLNNEFDAFLRYAKIGTFSASDEENRTRRVDFMEHRRQQTLGFAGTRESDARMIVRYFLEQILADPAFKLPVPLFAPEMLEILKGHKDQGHLVVLVSGTNYHLLEGIAPIVRADFVIGSRLKVRDGVLEPIIETPLSMHLGDAALLFGFLDAVGGDCDHLWCYGNNPVTDFPMLLMPTNRAQAIVVNPAPKMKRVLAMTHTRTLSFSGLSTFSQGIVSRKQIEARRNEVIMRIAQDYLSKR